MVRAEITGRHCFVFVKMDEGVGMGVLFDGKLYHGPHMAAGEFGQMVIETATGEERHDRPGCIERLISNAAICDRYAALTGAWRQPSTGDTSARVRRIAEWAIGGDAAARKTVEETARYLGVGISNLIWGPRRRYRRHRRHHHRSMGHGRTGAPPSTSRQ